MDPVNTLKRPFKMPGAGGGGSGSGSGWASTTSTAGGDAGRYVGGGSGAGTAAAAASSEAKNGSSPFTLQQTGFSFGKQHNMLANAVKRIKNNTGGVTYRDGESTGYEDDGSEVPDLVSIYKPPNKSQALPPFSIPSPACNVSSTNSHLTALGTKSRNTEVNVSGTISQSTRTGASANRYYKVGLV